VLVVYIIIRADQRIRLWSGGGLVSKRPPPRRVVINGAELHYIEQGRGSPVVFVHGGLGDFRTWGPQLAPFAAHYRAISYSRRAHYPNAWPPDYAHCAMSIHAADLAALIARLAAGPVHLVANSYGGYVGLLLATRQPELVRSLALAEPPVHPLLRRLPEGAALFEAFMTAAWRPAGRAFAAGNLEEGVRRFLDGAIGPGAFDQLPPPVRVGMMLNARAMSVEALTPFEVYMPDLPDSALQAITAPTLLLRGADSPVMYHRINAALAARLPHAEQALIPAASHVLHSQNPVAHNAAVLAFLGRMK
jgi:pimeloyl-ACP methyl ester carboxylesterase